jgi:uncharacterized protein
MTTDTSIAIDRVAAVGAMYDAFGRGDIPYIIDQLSDDVSWEEGLRNTGLPWLQPGTGQAHVREFFVQLGSGVQFTTFEPLVIAQSGDAVVGVVREASITLKTGATAASDLFAHLWRFDAAGKVVSFRHIGDWHNLEQAARGIAS